VSETLTQDDTTEDRLEPTGHPVVDEVLAAVDGLEHRPASEHLAVFETAHDRLRGALAEHATTPDA
jgi:hypothetical protein